MRFKTGFDEDDGFDVQTGAVLAVFSRAERLVDQALTIEPGHAKVAGIPEMDVAINDRTVRHGQILSEQSRAATMRER
jgi:hypothetical protein